MAQPHPTSEAVGQSDERRAGGFCPQGSTLIASAIRNSSIWRYCDVRFIVILALIGLGAGMFIGSVLPPWTARAADPATRAKVGEFSTVRIDQQKSDPSALDIYLGGRGKSVRFFSPEPNQRGPRTYFNDAGMLYTNGWITISGTMSGEGDGYNIVPPSLLNGQQDPAMLYVWSDVIGPAIEVRTRTRTIPAAIFFKRWVGMPSTPSALSKMGDSAGEKRNAPTWTRTFIARAKDAEDRWRLVIGNAVAVGTAGQASTLHVGGSQSVQRTAVVADYTVTDADYYVAVADTSGATNRHLTYRFGQDWPCVCGQR